ncbi:hypothetical protein BerOc1_01661 [Pseudodesulfovibrio hydrargyri]|uniref:Uncharacterized protein n=1 Tax=Pseudodesulfovibrio hydrargyri TaxID=2125990 RepID=A0A1J5N4H1_9BACT|nr:hypothetical protein BerOc1_01661 [Pseudodesulfovibrio hydrargyri]
MRLAVIIKAEQKEELPTAAELREAGFAVSTALGPDRDAAEPGHAPPGPCVCGEQDRPGRIAVSRNDEAPDAGKGARGFGLVDRWRKRARGCPRTP